MLLSLERAGLETLHVENLHNDYAETLRHWSTRLDENLQEATRIAGEEARVWRLYLRAARNGFETGQTAVYQMLCSAPLTEPRAPARRAAAEARRAGACPLSPRSRVIRSAAGAEPKGMANRPQFAAVVIGVIALFLGMDQFVGAGGQLLLGGATWAVLIWACASLSPDERARVALVVTVATCAEVLGSVVLGVYEHGFEPAGLRAAGPRARLPRGLAISGWVIERGRPGAFIAE